MTADRDKVLDTLTAVTQANDETGRLTLYAVVCPEHGGLICRDAAQALNGMEQANRENAGCSYVALALTLDPHNLPTFPFEVE